MNRLVLSREEMYARFLERDADCNGRFVVGVRTTGIYCLPTCPARKAKLENMLFFPDEATAIDAGLRSCRRCRPDHFYRQYDPTLERITKLVAEIRNDPAGFPDIAAMATACGLGKTKLNHALREHYHESPASFLTRTRVLAVAERLLSTKTKPLDLAYELGFESASAFHDSFAKQLAMRPLDYRKLGRDAVFTLQLPIDFQHERTLKLLGRDPSSLTERLDGRRFAKALRLDGRNGLLTIYLTQRTARCQVESERKISPAGMAQAQAVALRVLGLQCDPTALQKLVLRTKGLRRLTRGREGLRVLLTADVFEALLWSIIGQQVNLAFAMRLRTRLVELTSGHQSASHLVGLRPHPQAADIAKLDYDDLKPFQFSRRKAEYVIDISRCIASGELDLDRLAGSSATRAAQVLLALRGIGPWSANYVMMRGIGFHDSLPVGDSGIGASLQSFFGLSKRPNAKETVALMKPFRPHRSLACLHLWQRLGDANT